MNWFEKFLHQLKDNIAETIRKFTAYSYILFFFGALYGVFASRISEITGIAINFVIAAPLILALLAYLSTEIAAVLFIGLLVLMGLLFL